MGKKKNVVFELKPGQSITIPGRKQPVNKRELKWLAGHFVKSNLLETLLPDNDPFRAYARGRGYQYFRISIESVDEPKRELFFYTFAKPPTHAKYWLAFQDIANYPDELLEQIPVRFDLGTGEEVQGNAKQIIKMKGLGGRNEEYSEYYQKWKESRYDPKVKRQLKQVYVCENRDDYAPERFERTMKRYKQRDRQRVSKSR